MNTLLNKAIEYARAGYRVIPLRGKIPLTGHGAHDSTTNEATIRKWWKRWPDANIGMTLEGLVVVDVDPRNGGDATLLPQPLPATCLARTGGGGWHYLYRAATNTRYPGMLAVGIDCKSGPGAYIVIAPSTHASGQVYEWLSDSFSTQPAPAPEWMARKPTVATQPGTRRQPLKQTCGSNKWIVIDDNDQPTGETIKFNAWTESELAA